MIILIFLCVLCGFLVFAERRIPANQRVIFVFEDFFAKKNKDLTCNIIRFYCYLSLRTVRQLADGEAISTGTRDCTPKAHLGHRS